MANPAAVLSVVVKAMGIKSANAQIATTDSTLKKTGKTADQTTTKVQKHAKSYDALGRKAGLVAIGVGAIGAASLKAAGDFEQSLDIFQSTANATGKEMRSVSKMAKRLGADIKLPGTSAADAADALTELAKGGLSVKDAMGAARGTLQLAAAAQMGNAEAATITARALNAFGLRGVKAGKVSDMLAASANASTAEIGDMAQALQQSSAAAASLKVPMSSLTTQIGLMANKGIIGSDAGTSLKTMMARFVPQTNKAADAMAKFGIMTEEGNNRLFDAKGRFVGMERAIKIFHSRLAPLTDEQRQEALSTIFGSDAKRAAQVIMMGGVKAYQKMHKAVTEQGAAEKMATAKNKGFKGSLDAFKSTVETLAITFGERLLPAATAAMRWLSRMFTSMGSNIKLVVDITAAIGLAATAIWLAVKATAAWNAMMTLNPWVAATVAILALAAAVVVAYRNSETFRRILQGTLEWLSNAARNVGSAVTGAFSKMAGAFRSTTGAIGKEVRQWDTLFGFIRNMAALLGAVFRVPLGVMKTTLQVGMLALVPVVRGAWEVIKGVFRGAFVVLRALVTGGLQAVRGVIRIFGGLFKGDFGQVWEGIKDVFRGAFTIITGLLKGWGAVLRGIVAGIKTTLVGGFSSLWKAIKGVFEGGVNAVIDFMNVIIEAINLLPFLKDIKPIGHIGGGGGGAGGANKSPGSDAAQMAKGGAFGRTAGMVRKPMVMMGEEAPRHPEFVIPTNPAYRKQARGLLAQAAGAVGFAEGGVVSAFRSTAHKVGAAGRSQLALWMAGIVESGLRNLPYGDADSTGALQVRASTAGPMGIDPMNPAQVALAFLTRGFWGKGGAMALDRSNPGQTAGWIAQQVQGSDYPDRYDQVAAEAQKYMKGAGGGGGILGGALGTGLSAIEIIKKLPNPLKMLPEWLQPMGTGIIDKAKNFIKDKVGGALGGKATGSVEKAIMLATSMGHPHPTAGQMAGGTHAQGSLHYAGRAVDFGDAGQSVSKMAKLHGALASTFGSSINELFYDRMPWFIDNFRKIQGQFGGHLDHIHIGFQEGGIFGALMALQKGGTIGKAGAGRAGLRPGTMARPGLGNLTEAFKLIKAGGSTGVRGLIHDQIKALGLPGWLAGDLTTLAGRSNEFGEYADRAGQLTDVEAIRGALVNELNARGSLAKFPEADQMAMVEAMQGRVGGRTQLDWLKSQLEVVFAWRNRIVEAIRIAIERHAEIVRLLGVARERLRQVREAMEHAAGRRRDLVGNVNQGQGRIGRLRDRLEELRKHPKRNARKIADVKDDIEHVRANIAEWRARIEFIDSEQRGRERLRSALADAGGIIPTLVTQREAVSTARGELGGTLDQVQGLGGGREIMGALPALGVLGGTIFDVQMRAQQLAGEHGKLRVTDDDLKAVGAVDDPTKELLAQLLREANLRTAVSEAHFKALASMPYGGSFGGGGVVPGAPGSPVLITAHGGEVVSDGGDIRVVVEGGEAMAFLKRFIRVEVEGTTRGQARSARQLPGRPGNLGQ